MSGQSPYGIINPSRLLTPAQVAKRASVSVRTLQRYVKQGIIPLPVQISPNRIGFYEHEVEEWLSSVPRVQEAA